MSLIIDSLAKLAEKFSQKYPGEASGVATLDGSSKVVEDPGSAAYTKGGASGILGLDANSRIAADQAFSTGGSDTHKAMGVIDYQDTTVGNVGSGEDDLMSYTLPANTLNSDGKAIRVTAWGTGNGVDNINLRFHFGSDITAFHGASPIIQWMVILIVARSATSVQKGSGLLQASNPVALNINATEDETSGIVVKFTGQNLSDTSDNAVQQAGMMIEVLN